MECKTAVKTAIKTGSPKATRCLDVTVLLGGPSTEREVSLVSGAAIADALARLGHKVTRSDISPSNVSALDRKGIDVVFIALHGKFGESGEVQQLCEDRKLPYTGSPARASQIAIDKDLTKRALAKAGLPTADWVVLESNGRSADNAAVAELGLPVVVKPIDGGSSVDVYITGDSSTRDTAIDKVLTRYGRAMVEKFIKGREFTIGVLQEKALPVLEIVATRGFYDYTAKYSDQGGTRYVFDHGLPAETVKEMQRLAEAAHSCLGCRDMSRIDFIVDQADKPWLLEINTIPGFTGHSLLPMAAGKAGVSFDQLVDRLVNMALNR